MYNWWKAHGHVDPSKRRKRSKSVARRFNLLSRRVAILSRGVTLWKAGEIFNHAHKPYLHPTAFLQPWCNLSEIDLLKNKPNWTKSGWTGFGPEFRPTRNIRMDSELIPGWVFGTALSPDSSWFSSGLFRINRNSGLIPNQFRIARICAINS